MTDTTQEPTEAPAPQIVPVWTEFETRFGDTLQHIAWMRGLDVIHLLQLNPQITNPYGLLIGGLHVRTS